jgi:hypothetical protein
MSRREALSGLVLGALLGLEACVRSPSVPTPGRRTVEDVVAGIGPSVRPQLTALARYAGLDYPPREIALLGFKRERRLEVWGRDEGPWSRIDALPILAASGGPGPKQREGDRQVPEGLYRVIGLNPNSRYHLSLALDYPNAFDLAEAERDGRDDPGGEIFIHGGARSIGCLAIGDRAVEALFVLVADVGIERVQVILAPRDPRGTVPLAPLPAVPFTAELYPLLEESLRPFRVPAGI